MEEKSEFQGQCRSIWELSFKSSREVIMAKKSEETITSKAVPRESDNPIVEEYKEDMLKKPTYRARPSLDDEERLCRMEALLAEICQKAEDLEKRVKALEAR